MLPAVKKRRTRRPDNGSYWTSFSDMLSSVLLVIMLALVFSIYQYYSQLDIKTKELEAQKSELDKTLIILSAQQQELDAAHSVNRRLLSQEGPHASLPSPFSGAV